jgi:hypothetical protein
MEPTVRGRGRTKKLQIAFYSWVKGYFVDPFREQLKGLGEKEMETVTTAGIRVQRRSLPDYATADFWECVQMWRDWEIFGNPESGGTLDQPALWFDIVRVMQDCADNMKVE